MNEIASPAPTVYKSPGHNRSRTRSLKRSNSDPGSLSELNDTETKSKEQDLMTLRIRGNDIARGSNYMSPIPVLSLPLVEDSPDGMDDEDEVGTKKNMKVETHIIYDADEPEDIKALKKKVSEMEYEYSWLSQQHSQANEMNLHLQARAEQALNAEQVNQAIIISQAEAELNAARQSDLANKMKIQQDAETVRKL